MRSLPSRAAKTLLLGQTVSFLYVASGAFQSQLQFECGISAPTVAAVFLYLFLSSFLLRSFWKNRRTGKRKRLSIPEYHHDHRSEESTCSHANKPSRTAAGSSSSVHTFCGLPLEGSPWAYAVVALVDLESFYCVTLAYRYTTVTSIPILFSVATPASMIFSKWMLRRTYTRRHWMGMILCLSGVVWNVNLDATEEEAAPILSGHGKLKGAFFALTGGVLSGLQDVLCENLVQHIGGGTHEYLGMLGFFGLAFAVFQLVLFEQEEVHSIVSQQQADDDRCSSGYLWSLFGGSALLGAISYFFAARFLEISEAALLNLSLLTETIWSVTFSVFVQQTFPDRLFYLGFLSITGGLYLYNSAARA